MKVNLVFSLSSLSMMYLVASSVARIPACKEAEGCDTDVDTITYVSETGSKSKERSRQWSLFVNPGGEGETYWRISTWSSILATTRDLL